ncbi:hypothetical protein EK904_005011 [Melospiza melodia maxima]|nr:hypothetical protein EK904_005011 [Melospiza melodia maxima]
MPDKGQLLNWLKGHRCAFDAVMSREILTDLSGLSMDCTNLRESTEAERMVSVRPRRNMRSDALSYVAQARPYILGQRGERHSTESALAEPGISNAEEKQGQDSRELHDVVQKSNDGWAFGGSVLIYETTGAIFSNDELGQKHERTVLKTGNV